LQYQAKKKIRLFHENNTFKIKIILDRHGPSQTTKPLPSSVPGFYYLSLIRAGIFKESMGARNRGGIGLSYPPARAGIFKKSMGARHRGGIGLSYRPARLHSLAEFISWNRFLGSIDV
jgi:hypothetical protein